jgi:hypothetical protein
LLGGSDATFPGSGEGRAEQGATVGEGELFAGVEDGAIGGLVGERAKMRNVGDGLLQGEAFGIVAVFDGQGRHQRTSLFFQSSSPTTLLTPDAKIERNTLRPWSHLESCDHASVPL